MSRRGRAAGCLLDTHTILFALGQPERLSEPVRRAVLEGPNVLSVLSYWEVVLKAAKGKLAVGDVRVWWAEALLALRATELPLRAAHIEALQALPEHHKDPFDRMLMAQATVEGMVFLSQDEAVALYASERLRILR